MHGRARKKMEAGRHRMARGAGESRGRAKRERCMNMTYDGQGGRESERRVRGRGRRLESRRQRE